MAVRATSARVTSCQSCLFSGNAHVSRSSEAGQAFDKQLHAFAYGAGDEAFSYLTINSNKDGEGHERRQRNGKGN